MNQFIVHPLQRPPTPDEVVRGVMGISAQELIRAIIENKGGKYDALYTANDAEDADR